MASGRQPGSDHGRPAIDWESAFHYYATLPDPDRSYQAVANHYAVSVRTVEKHGRLENWKERLARVRAEAVDVADARIAEVRAEKLAELDLLIDASWTTYAHQLRAGSVRVAPVDLVRLFKLREDLWAQAAAESTARRTAAAAEIDTDEDHEARKQEIIRALHEAGAFDRLQTLLTSQPNDGAAPGTEAA